MIMQFFLPDKEIKGNERKISFFLGGGGGAIFFMQSSRKSVLGVTMVVKLKTDFRGSPDGAFVCSTILFFG